MYTNHTIGGLYIESHHRQQIISRQQRLVSFGITIMVRVRVRVRVIEEIHLASTIIIQWHFRLSISSGTFVCLYLLALSFVHIYWHFRLSISSGTYVCLYLVALPPVPIKPVPIDSVPINPIPNP